MHADLPNPVAIAALFIGVVLWLMGGKLLRVGACLMGLAIGGILAMVMVPPPFDVTLALVWVVLAAAVGLALGWVLFRLWMGLSLALVLSLAVPLTVLAFEGIDPPGVQQNEQSSPGPMSADVSQISMTPQQQEQVEQLRRATSSTIDPAVTTTSQWWRSLPETTQNSIERYALAAAVAGLLFGLLVPTTAATFQSALLGSVLILASAVALAPAYAPALAPHLPTNAKSFLVITFLLTATGFIIQWSIQRPKADKEPVEAA